MNIDINNINKIHFIGIGGIGISAIARMMLLEGKGISIPLLIGSAVHAGIEVLLDPNLETAFNLRLAPAIKATDRLFIALEDRPDLTAALGPKLEHARATAHACVEAWWCVNGDDLEKEWKILHVEYIMRAKPDATLDSPLQDRAAGKIDGVLLDPNEECWIIDHKTRGRMDNIDILGLELDLQALWYLCNYERRKPTGLPSAKGLLYDAIQKPQHRINNKGWEDLKNRMFEAMIADPGKYLYLQPIPISKETQERAWTNFLRIVANMDHLSSGSVYQNLTACNDYGGCPYRPLCHAGAYADNPEAVLETPGIDFYQIKAPHQELIPLEERFTSSPLADS